MGLIKAPPPVVKLSNMMRVLGKEAAADPSKVEKMVRQQMTQRIKSHEMRNASRKLNKVEKKKKNYF